QAGMLLNEDVHVDITTAGVFDGPEDMSPGVISAGTIVDSYLVHQDPRGPRGHILLSCKIHFDREIIGVIVDKQTLADSDAMLGDPHTVYPEGIFPRGLDFRQPLEAIKISADRHTLRYTLYTTVAIDQIRILTAAAPAP